MRPHSLFVIGGLFAVAFLSRAATMAARAADAPPPPDAEARRKTACLTGPVADELATGIDRLEARGAALAEREAKAALLLEESRKSFAEAEKLNAALESLLARIETADDAQSKRVASIYEGMKPKEAGPILDRMPIELAAGVIGAMEPGAAAAALAAMEPAKAQIVTARLAGAGL